MIEQLANIPAGMWAVIGTIFTGVGLKATETFLTRKKSDNDLNSSWRKELRDEVKELREEVDQLKSETEKWRKQYFDVQDEYLAYRTILATKVEPSVVEELRQAAKSIREARVTDTVA